MVTYSEITDTHGNSFVERINDDGTVDSIPTDLANSDYQEYLDSLKQ